MTTPTWLIAEREFRTYVATLSFWIALAIGPMLMVGALALSTRSAIPTAVFIRSDDPQIERSAADALYEAGENEGQRFRQVGTGARYSLFLEPGSGNTIEMYYSAGFPLSRGGRLFLARTLQRDWAFRKLSKAVNASPPLAVHDVNAGVSPTRQDAAALSKFALVGILWLTLTGSLGMLLQAVVRERANRTLEGLLAAARPWEIMAGKLIGVGSVSLMILFAWLGFALGLSALAGHGSGLVPRVLEGLGSPPELLRAAIIYLFAYTFYGSVTIGLGAAARDIATAQNLSRPMFAVLLVAFFMALAEASGSSFSGLIFVPPFTPFVLLLCNADAVPLLSQGLALGIMLLTTVVAAKLAIGSLTMPDASAGRFKVGRPITCSNALPSN